MKIFFLGFFADRERVSLLREEQQLRESLPDVVQKLILGYELRTFYFELFDVRTDPSPNLLPTSPADSGVNVESHCSASASSQLSACPSSSARRALSVSSSLV